MQDDIPLTKKYKDAVATIQTLVYPPDAWVIVEAVFRAIDEPIVAGMVAAKPSNVSLFNVGDRVRLVLDYGTRYHKGTAGTVKKVSFDLNSVFVHFESIESSQWIHVAGLEKLEPSQATKTPVKLYVNDTVRLKQEIDVPSIVPKSIGTILNIDITDTHAFVKFHVSHEEPKLWVNLSFLERAA